MQNTVIKLDTARAEEKLKFIELRAKGYSYNKITKELNVSKATLTAWNEELKEHISILKAEHLRELYASYGMYKTARIQALGDTLLKIEDALSNADLTELPPDKLLDYKLKYMETLNNEYVSLPDETARKKEINPEVITMELMSLYERVKEGIVPKEQAREESYILSSLIKAFETMELNKKVEALEMVIGGRR